MIIRETAKSLKKQARVDQVKNSRLKSMKYHVNDR